MLSSRRISSRSDRLVDDSELDATIDKAEHPQPEGVFIPETKLRHRITDSVEVHGNPIKLTAEFPEILVDPRMIYIVNGFGGYKATARGLRESCVDAGFATCTAEPVRVTDRSSWDDLTDPQAAHVASHSAVSHTITDHPKLKTMPNGSEVQTQGALWVPHSMGGLSVARFAEESPGEVGGIINLMAAGYGSPGILQLAKTLPKGIPNGITHELLPYLRSGYINPDIHNLLQIMRYYGRNPTRTLGEALSCVTQNVRPRIERIRKMGTLVGYLAAEYDCLVPPDDRISDQVDYYYSIRDMGHLGPQLKPSIVATHITQIALNNFYRPLK